METERHLTEQEASHLALVLYLTCITLTLHEAMVLSITTREGSHDLMALKLI